MASAARLSRSAEIPAITLQTDIPVRTLDRSRVIPRRGLWRHALSRSSLAARTAALSAVAVGVAALVLPTASAGAANGHRSLRDELVSRAGGHAQFAAAKGTAGPFFGAAPGHAATRPADISADDSPASAALGWMRHYGAAFGVRDAAHDVHATATTATVAGSVVKLQQTVSGLPVVGGELAVVLDDTNRLVSAFGHVSPAATVPTTPAVSASAAKQLAVRA